MIIKAGVTYFCKFALAIYYMNHQREHLIVLMKKSFFIKHFIVQISFKVIYPSKLLYCKRISRKPS